MSKVLLLLCAVATAAELPDLEFRMGEKNCVAILSSKSSQPISAYWVGSTSGEKRSSFSSDMLGVKNRSEYRHELRNQEDCRDAQNQHVLAVIYADGTTAGEPKFVEALLSARRAELVATRRWIKRMSSPKFSAEKFSKELDVQLQATPYSESLEESVLQSTEEGHVRTGALRLKRDLDRKGADYALEQLLKREAALAASRPSLEP